MDFDWTAPDGVTFPCEQWLPPQKAGGTVICVHGLSGAAMDFLPLGERVHQAGLACFALNLRGRETIRTVPAAERLSTLKPFLGTFRRSRRSCILASLEHRFGFAARVWAH